MATSIKIIFAVLIFYAIFYENQAAECPLHCFCIQGSVSCTQRKLKNIPADVPSNATVLDLRFNEIDNIEDGTFQNAARLNTLLLNNNALVILTHNMFEGLHSLRYLYLYKNRIHTIEENAFRNLKTLEYLYLEHNRIASLDGVTFSAMTNLKRLFLHNNKLQKLMEETFVNLKSLKNLRLDSNPIMCDCEVFWLMKTFRERNGVTMEISGNCHLPSTYQGLPLTGLYNISSIQCSIPRLISVPRDLEVILDETESVFLQCEAKGYPDPHIIWMKDDLDINLMKSPYTAFRTGLRIEPIAPKNSGNYKCMAKNRYGEAQSPVARLLVKYIAPEKPSITDLPENYSAVEGETLNVTCSAKGHPKPHIFWLQSNLAIIRLHRRSLHGLLMSTNDTMSIASVERNNSGIYTCVAVNSNGRVSASLNLTVNVPPTIISFFKSRTIESETTLKLECVAEGIPTPIISWFRNGSSVVFNDRVYEQNNGTGTSTLIIENTKGSDGGMFNCVAQNLVNSAEAGNEIHIKNVNEKQAYIVVPPFDVDAVERTSVEIPCKVDGTPPVNVTWYKNGARLKLDNDNRKLSRVGSLRLYNISLVDSAVYTCIAANAFGNASASGSLTVVGTLVSDRTEEYIRKAYKEAVFEIDRAINATINNMFSRPTNASAISPGTLMRILRFPDETAREIIKPADIYTRTLDNVRKHILTGIKLNLTSEFSYHERLTRDQLDLIANLSGCVARLIEPNCTNATFHSKYSNIDGTCNNLENLMWGASHTAFRRLLNPIYENGFSSPVGWNKDLKYYGYPKPPARLVSTSLIRTYDITPDTEITHMVMQWGQFLDHDLDHSLPSTTAESWEGIDCKKTCAYSEPCFPIEVPANDTRIKNRRCMDFIRTSAVCGSGTTSVFFDGLQQRQQINQLTSYIDATQVYGFTRDRSFLIRDIQVDLGLLREGILSETGKPHLPSAGLAEVDCRRNLEETNIGCFLAGDIRVNEQIGLTAMHTIWLREHNRIARKLRIINPHWQGETIFQETRKIIIAQMQRIVFEHWLPHILGTKGMNMLGKYQGYNKNIDASISNVFATAALRMGHTLINPIHRRLDHNFNVIPQGHLPLGKAFFAPWRVVNEGGIDPLIRGLFMTPAKLKRPKENMNDQLIDHLFTTAHAVALDLASLNIQRARDHGLPGYLEYRRFCNLSIPQTFDDLRADIADADVRQKLKELYGHPGNIDIWVGGVLEDELEDARIGPTFVCLLVEQFKRLRDGDRFHYENPTVFKPDQLEEIRKTSLARVLCDNGDNITRITKNVFLLPDRQQPGLVGCFEIPEINLTKWRQI